jgi:hypothetical protein
VYCDVVPLVHLTNGLTIGDIVDWLVLMDRLDERLMLDSVIAEKRLASLATRPPCRRIHRILSSRERGACAASSVNRERV